MSITFKESAITREDSGILVSPFQAWISGTAPTYHHVISITDGVTGDQSGSFELPIGAQVKAYDAWFVKSGSAGSAGDVISVHRVISSSLTTGTLVPSTGWSTNPNVASPSARSSATSWNFSSASLGPKDKVEIHATSVSGTVGSEVHILFELK